MVFCQALVSSSISAFLALAIFEEHITTCVVINKVIMLKMI